MSDFDGSLTAIRLDSGHRVGMRASLRLAGSYRQRCLAASSYVGPKRAAIAGRSAAWLLGVRLAGETDPVEVVTPWSARFGPVDGLKIHVADLPEDDVRVVDGVRRTSAVRTCWDLAQWLPLPDAVAYLDIMIARRLVTAAALVAYARQRAGRRGWRKLQRAVSLTDPAATSGRESRLRVRLVLAGLPKPVSQYVIERDGRSVGRVDLAWPKLRVAIVRSGTERDGVVTTDGWIILHVTGRAVRVDFDGFVADVRSAVRSRRVGG
jgi:hypothetical protein